MDCAVAQVAQLAVDAEDSAAGVGSDLRVRRAVGLGPRQPELEDLALCLEQSRLEVDDVVAQLVVFRLKGLVQLA